PRDRIARERLAVGVEQIFSFSDAGWVRVLDDHAGGGALLIELGDAFVSGVGVVEIVVGELLALQLTRGRNAVALIGSAIERRRLGRVLAVAQGLGERAADRAPRRRSLADLPGKPVGDGGVIGGGARVGLGGEPPAQGEGGGAAVGS